MRIRCTPFSRWSARGLDLGLDIPHHEATGLFEQIAVPARYVGEDCYRFGWPAHPARTMSASLTTPF
jgi:hypothetical protein